MREYIMKTTRKIGFIPVILLCAAFVMVPMVAAAGPGQENNQGNNQGQGGFSQGGMMMPDNGQNSNAGTDQNTGNANAPKGPPRGDFRNMTGNIPMPEPGDGNMTAFGNITFNHPPMDSNMTVPGNWTAPDNRMIPGPSDGNMTPSQLPPDNGNTNGSANQNGQIGAAGTQSDQPQGDSVNQAQSQDLKDSDLIASFLKWLKGQSGS
jgi:hypothetical protein